jgi:DNA-binding NarL/FixJ family response regulator
VDQLTERELEVLAMVPRGHPNKVIAFNLGVSAHTVKVHLHNIIFKLGVRNRTEAAAMYFKHMDGREKAGR